jgi:hypothetical protein
MSNSSGNCFQVVNSPILAEYNDIMISDALPNVRNQTALETFFKQLGTAAKNGKAAFQCSKNDDYGQVRYFSSTYIASIVTDQARNCSNTKQVPILCKNIVETAKKSFDDYLIKNQCSNAFAIRLDKYLAMVNSRTNEDGCFSGLFIERQQCGRKHYY